MTGVRAEPKYLRDPTSFETLSSGLSRLSSYVTSNLPKRKSTFPPYLPAQDPQLLYYQQQLLQQQRSTAAINNNNNNNINNNLTTDNNNNNTTTNKDEDNDPTETITFASFEKFDSHLGKVSCLLLGYEQGFQLWNVSQPDNVHELASIRLDNIGIVTKLHVLSTPTLSSSKQDQYKDKRPLLAIISTNHQEGKTPHESADTTSNQPSPSLPPQDSASKTIKSSFHLYSLKTHEFIPLDLNISEDTVITDVKSNGKIIVLGCKNQNQSSIQLLSSYDLSTAYTTLTDVSHQPDGPVFTLGSRLLAYATTLQVLNNDTNNTNTDKDVKEAAKDIAKEMVNGVKSLGEFGYNRLSNYFSQNNQEMVSVNNNNMNSINMNNPTTSPYYNPSMSSPSSEPRDISLISSSSTTLTSIQKQTPTGMVIIRDISKLPTSSIKFNTLSLSTVAHFKPHSHPIAILSFNVAGNLLMSVSKQGHTFHIFSMYPTDRHLANAAHLYNLSRGYTDARVVDCQFSIDSTWCAVTTARGTTHMYTINPYGGKPEINAHVNGKINNLVNPPFVTKKKPFVTSLGPAVRVKQRRPLSTDSSALSENQGLETNSAPSNGIYPSSAMPSSSPSPPLFYNSQRWQPTTTTTKITKLHRADLTTMFLSVTHVPTTLQGNHNHHHHHPSPQPLSHIPNSNQLSKVNSPLPPPATLTSIKNQASTLVSQVSSYLPNAQRDWTWAKDKSNDNRMFGFDEEESTLDDDSATKIINDSTGYQDVYSFHPTGVLTLHRLWVTKSMVKKRVQGRTVGKWDLSVKEEDIAEWQIARSLDWKEVTIPIHGSNSSSSMGTTLWKDDSDEDEDDNNNNTIYGEKNILSEIQEPEELTDSSSNSHHNNNTPSTKKKKKQKNQNKNDQNSNDSNKNKNIDPSPSSSSNNNNNNNNNNKDNNSNLPQQVTNHWLSHAEIMTYANNTMTQDPPLWSNPQFTFQIYTESNNKESKTPSSSSIASMLSSGIVPPTAPLVVRSETPEPYTSRINRIGKTNAVARSLDNEENMDDALAELEENLSTAMQTSFVPSSTTASPRHSSMRLSSSAGTQSSIQRKTRSDQTSSLSFENAYLISMGGVPVYRAANHNNYQKQNDEDDDENNNNNNNNNNNINRIYQPTTSTSSPVHLSTSMQGSSLIQFDSDNDVDMNSNNSSSSNILNHSTTNVNSNNNDNDLNNSMSKMMIMEDQQSDNNVNIASSSSLLGSFGIQGLDDGDDSIRLVGDDDDKDFGDIVFSPDGDNEIEYPSDSVVFGR